MSINKVILIGRLGADPEIKSFQNGDRVANVRLATSERWKDKQTGEKKERTEWHAVAIFGPLVDVVERYTKKGSQIYIEGQLRTRKWQDQAGNDRYTTEIALQGIGAKLSLLDSAGGNGEHGRQHQDGSRSGGQPPAGAGRGMDWNESNNGPGRGSFADDLDDDIPF